MDPRLERRRKIWVVDDSATDAERVRRLLIAEHYDVDVIQDGAAALERLASGHAPDLLLLDWLMPGMSGIEVCRYVRSLGEKFLQMPILLLTARHGTQEVIEAFRSGANDYVSKPFVDEELKARVAALLATNRLLERAQYAEEDLRALLTTTPDPIFVVDAQGLITFANDEALRICELPKDRILNQPFGTLVPGVSLQNISVGPGEGFLPAPDVKVRDRVFAPSIRVLPSDNSATTTVALRDVTVRRKSEARRLDFYSVIAHDLRTPITSVLLRMEMALRGKRGVLPAEHLDDLRRTHASLRSLVGMINDFLELARLEGVGYKIDRKPVDIGELIQLTMDDFLPLLEKNELRWKASGLELGATVLGDRQRLTQVLSNLIGNAIKFTPTAGTISTSVTVIGPHVEIAVEDTGRGIAEDEIPGLFERFSRARESSGDTPGTGLGLMIVREIVEAHGGTIGVRSKPGSGSRFSVRLPSGQVQQGPAADLVKR